MPFCLCRDLIYFHGSLLLAGLHKHKENIEKYIYFNGIVRVGKNYYTVRFATEQVKGQSPDLLDLYNVHIKRGVLHNSTDHPSTVNISQSGTNVKTYLQKGSFDANSKVIKLFENADASTLDHELPISTDRLTPRRRYLGRYIVPSTGTPYVILLDTPCNIAYALSSAAVAVTTDETEGD